MNDLSMDDVLEQHITSLYEFFAGAAGRLGMLEMVRLHVVFQSRLSYLVNDLIVDGPDGPRSNLPGFPGPPGVDLVIADG